MLYVYREARIRPMMARRLNEGWPVLRSLVCVLALLLLPSAGSAGEAELSQRACDFPTAKGPALRCYTLRVPLNRSDPASALIALPVVVIAGSRPHDTPLAYIRGGPGYALDLNGAGISDWESRIEKDPWLQGGDLILMEQRGQGGDVTLACPEVDAALRDLIDQPEPQRGEAYKKAASACHDVLVGKYHLGDFDTAAVADDLEDLRQKLGIRQWNVYGVSYGTRVALLLMKRHPAGLRSVILDSANPPEARSWETQRADIDNALDEVAKACAQSRDCPNEAWLKQTLKQQAAAYDAAPPRIAPFEGSGLSRPINFTGALLRERVFDMLDDKNPAKEIPAFLKALPADTEVLKDAVRELANNDYAGDPQDGLLLGRYFATTCREELPFSEPAKMEADRAAHSWLTDYGVDGDDPLACMDWVDPDARQVISKAPIESDIPTLVLQGRFDALTPPEIGERTWSRLRRAYFCEIADVGHEVVHYSAAGKKLAGSFFVDPNRVPDPSCRTHASP